VLGVVYEKAVVLCGYAVAARMMLDERIYAGDRSFEELEDA
jgi:hypothetical protein